MRRTNQNILPETALAAWNAVRPVKAAESVVTASCSLITPMYGGGVKAGEVDRDMPIRASSLRGQLRFWWRLLQGTGQEFKDSTELFAAEKAIWGGISGNGPQASRVIVQVESAQVFDHQLIPKSQSDVPPYALILERGEDPTLMKEGCSFDLVLRFNKQVTPRQREDVIEALRWWASFGGVGARTRRGLGAVKMTGDNLAPVTRKEVEAKGGWMVAGPAENNAVMAWKAAIGALQRFRQGKDLGRNPGQGLHPGRSRWPEADTIRRTTKRHAPMHEPEHPVDGFYPRASFGLPLVFHFKDRDDPKGRSSDSLVLNPKDGERMASPLVLRPYFDGQRYQRLALLLPGWRGRVSVPVHLDSRQGEPAWPKDSSERAQLAQRIKPMKDRGSDALSAFMRYFQETLTTGTR